MLLESWLPARGCGRVRDVLMVVMPIVQASLLYTMSVTTNEAIYASGYVVFHLDFELMRVLCEAEGARCVAAYRRAGAPRFAAVSGLNTTLALALQAALQLLFSRLEPQMQFRVLAAIFLALFAAYAGHSVVAGLASSCGMTRPGSDDTARGADDEAREEGQRYHCYDAAGSGTPST